MSSEGKFCSGCEHGAIYPRAAFCHRPLNKINVVSGRPFVSGRFCDAERAPIWWPFSDRCGPEGRHWKPDLSTIEPKEI